MVAPDYISGENKGREPPDDMHPDFLCKYAAPMLAAEKEKGKV
jgi:hypothetical protein